MPNLRVLIPAVLCLFLGSEVGKSLNRADRLHASQAQHTALETQPTGASVVWRSPDSGNTGRVTPTRTVHTPQGTVCREYRHEVTISGNTETVHGMPAGGRKLANSQPAIDELRPRPRATMTDRNHVPTHDSCPLISSGSV